MSDIKALMSHAMVSAQTAPMTMLVSRWHYGCLVVGCRAAEERWDWRRTKREMRRVGNNGYQPKREYHRLNLNRT